MDNTQTSPYLMPSLVRGRGSDPTRIAGHTPNWVGCGPSVAPPCDVGCGPSVAPPCDVGCGPSVAPPCDVGCGPSVAPPCDVGCGPSVAPPCDVGCGPSVAPPCDVGCGPSVAPPCDVGCGPSVAPPWKVLSLCSEFVLLHDSVFPSELLLAAICVPCPCSGSALATGTDACVLVIAMGTVAGLTNVFLTAL